MMHIKDRELAKAREHLAVGDAAAAIACLDAVVADDGAPPEAWLLRGEARLALGEAAAAAADFRAVLVGAVDLAPERWPALVRAAVAAFDALHGSAPGEAAVGGRPRDTTAPREDDLSITSPRAVDALLADGSEEPLEPANRTAATRDPERESLLAELQAAIDDAIEAEPETPGLFAARGEVYRARRQLENALAELTYATELDERYLEAWLVQADVAEALGQPQAAAEALDHAADLDPNNIRLFGRLGDAVMAYGDVSGAIAAYEEGLELAPNHAGLLAGRARASFLLDLYEDVVDDCRAVVAKHPDFVEGWVLLAQSLFRLGEDAPAGEALGEVLRRRPEHLSALGLRAALAAAGGDLEAAERDFATVLARRPDDAETRLQLAELKLAHGDAAAAAAEAEAVLARDPESVDAWLLLAEARDDAGDPPAVGATLDAAIDRVPGEPRLHLARAEDHFLASRPYLAWRDARWALDIDPGEVDGYVLRARIALEIEGPNEALADLDEAIDLDPDNPEAHAWRGRAFALAGNAEAAEESWAEAEDLIDADDPLRDDIAAWRDELRGAPRA